MKRPDTPQSFGTKARLQALGNSVAGLVPERRLATYRELVQVGEGKVALENLCEQLYDADIELPKAIFDEVRLLAKEVGIHSKHWQQLSAGGA
jgi:hypothetical protein